MYQPMKSMWRRLFHVLRLYHSVSLMKTIKNMSGEVAWLSWDTPNWEAYSHLMTMTFQMTDLPRFSSGFIREKKTIWKISTLSLFLRLKSLKKTIKDASLAPQKTGIKNNKNIVLDTLIQVALLLSSGLHLKENEFKRWVLQSTLSLKKIQIPENQMIIIGSKTLTILLN